MDLNEQQDTKRDAEIFYTNLTNTLSMFAKTAVDLKKMSAPLFDPLEEIQVELDYAFSPFCLQILFKELIPNPDLQNELHSFKSEATMLTPDLWDWNHIESHPTWGTLRKKANALLEKLGVESRDYNDDFSISFDSDGQVIKKGKKM